MCGGEIKVYICGYEFRRVTNYTFGTHPVYTYEQAVEITKAWDRLRAFECASSTPTI